MFWNHRFGCDTENEKTIIWILSILHHWYINLKSSLHSCCAIIDGIIFIKKRKKSNAVHLHWIRGVLKIINDVFVHSVFLEISYLEWYLQIISKLFQTPIIRWILISDKSILMYNLLLYMKRNNAFSGLWKEFKTFSFFQEWLSIVNITRCCQTPLNIEKLIFQVN